MKFKDFLDADDPPFEIFSRALDLVYDKGDGKTEHLDRLSSQARLIYLIWCFLGDLNNGGFNQTITNSIGNHLSEIHASLWSIEANTLHSQLSQVLSRFPNGVPPKDRMKRYELFESFSEDPEYVALEDALNSQYWTDTVEVPARLLVYIRNNQDSSIEA